MKKIGETATTKQGSQAVRKQLTKVTPKKVVQKVGGSMVPYVGAQIGYNTIYDKFNPQKPMMNFDEIDVNKISAVNKQAALNVKF